MSTVIRTICFADIVDSTKHGNDIGMKAMNILKQEFFSLSESLSSITDGHYVKDIGDEIMVVYDDFTKALKFAAFLVQFHQEKHNVKPREYSIRIGLASGPVETINNGMDYLGLGVNLSARVTNKSSINTVLIDETLLESLIAVFGLTSREELIGEKYDDIEIKGFDKPISLIELGLDAILMKHPEYHLASLLYQYLSNAKYQLANLDEVSISRVSRVIWPVVPRDKVNAIHKGQLELIKLLALQGIEVSVLVADWGLVSTGTPDYSDNFIERVRKYAEKIGMRDLEFQKMNDLIASGSESCCDITHSYYRQLLSKFTLKDMLDINHKNYEQSVREEIAKTATLNFLKPALTISTVMYLAGKESGKCIVIAGQDEHLQWEITSSELLGFRDKLGVIYTPVLSVRGKTNGHTASQKSNWPIYTSEQQLVNENERYHLIQWLAIFHIYLRHFPEAPSWLIEAGLYRFNDEMVDLENGHRGRIASVAYDSFFK